MDEGYVIKWSYESIYDVADIADNIELNFGLKRSDEFNDEIDMHVSRLSEVPYGYPDIEMWYRGLLIRKLVMSPSIVFYAVDDENKIVYILRVLREERDWRYILNRQNTYRF